jgi:cytochrome P450
MGDIPETDIDLFSDAALRDPYPRYRRLRDPGPVVRLTANDMYALPRYQQVREASGNWRVFSSAKGVMMNDEINSMLEGITLCSDPPEHTGMRRVLARPMRPELRGSRPGSGRRPSGSSHSSWPRAPSTPPPLASICP